MRASSSLGGEDTGGLDDVVGTYGAPRDGGRVSLVEDGDVLAVDDQLSTCNGDGTLVSTVGRVVLEHVDLLMHSTAFPVVSGVSSNEAGKK